MDAIHLIKKTGGSLKDSYLDEGFILEKKIGVGCPKRFENPKILIANTPMDTDKIKIYGAKVKVDSVAAVADIEDAEKERMWAKAKKIADHGIDCFINRQLIYNLPEEYFASRGIMAIGKYFSLISCIVLSRSLSVSFFASRPSLHTDTLHLFLLFTLSVSQFLALSFTLHISL